ncbi:MAG: hypothetical protein ABSC22_10425 [Roseiarcus sp.]
MTIVPLILILGAALLIGVGGYLFGVRRGYAAREALRAQTLRQAQELDSAHAELAQKAHSQEQSLRATIEQALAPFVQRDQLTLDLTRLRLGQGDRRDLTQLLDRIAEAGGFSDVVLSDEEGLPLAANKRARDGDRLAAGSSLILLMVDRIAKSDQAPPQAVLLHGEGGRTTLYRMFRAQDRRLTLTAVAPNDLRLTPSALDPALVGVRRMLASGN